MLELVNESGLFYLMIADKAAQHGQLHVLQWLHDHGCKMDSDVCASAAGGDHLHVLKWAHKQGYKLTGFHVACYLWHSRALTLEVMKWLVAHGYIMDQQTCAGAAAGGHMEALQWARTNGCPWDKHTCIEASQGGHFDVLNWARERCCVWVG